MTTTTDAAATTLEVATPVNPKVGLVERIGFGLLAWVLLTLVGVPLYLGVVWLLERRGVRYARGKGLLISVVGGWLFVFAMIALGPVIAGT